MAKVKNEGTRTIEVKAQKCPISKKDFLTKAKPLGLQVANASPNQATASPTSAASIAHPAATPAPIAHVCRPHGKVATEFTPKLPASNVAREATKAEAARAIGPNISSTDGVVWDASRMLTFAAPPYFLKPNGASRPRFNTREA